MLVYIRQVQTASEMSSKGTPNYYTHFLMNGASDLCSVELTRMTDNRSFAERMKIMPLPKFHSYRSAVSGSVFAAFRAGK
jgi:hypothetical protein